MRHKPELENFMKPVLEHESKIIINFELVWEWSMCVISYYLTWLVAEKSTAHVLFLHWFGYAIDLNMLIIITNFRNIYNQYMNNY